MNYKTVQKKNNKGKVAVIVINIIMVIALAVSAMAVYFHYFSNRLDENEKNRAKNVFEDTKLLDIKDLEELNGIYFPVEDLSYSGFEETISETTFYLSVINLHKFGFGNEFNVPEVGDYYRFDIEFNGEVFGAARMDIVKYGKARVEGNAVYNGYGENEVVIYLLPYFYSESESPWKEVILSADYHDRFLSERHEELVVDGYCFVVTSMQPIESLKFLNIEEL